MKVLWAEGALLDRREIIEYVALDNVAAAIRLDELFEDVAGRLAEYPQLGRAGLIPATRELIPHENYRLVYEVQADAVVILALVHTSRRWPPGG